MSSELIANTYISDYLQCAGNNVSNSFETLFGKEMAVLVGESGSINIVPVDLVVK